MKKHFIRNRKFRYGGITVILTLLVITVTILANAVFSTLAKRYRWYTSMLPGESYEVTEDCYEFLGKVAQAHPDKKVEILFCDLEENLIQEPLQAYLHETATSLEARYPDFIEVTCYDIWTNPNTVKKYASVVDPATGETIQTPIKSTSVIIVSEDYHRVYTINEFYVFKGGDTSNVWAYNGEKKLAAGIMRAAEPEAPIACITNNHSEVFYDYELMYLLDDAGYVIENIDLYNDPIPERCDLIISFNPNTDMIADEVSSVSEFKILDDFLAQEGNTFLVMVEDGTPSLPNLESYLAQWGVGFGYHTDSESGRPCRYMVQDASQSLTSDGYTIYGEAVKEGKSADMTDGLFRNVVFKNATALMPAQGFVSNGDGSYTKGNRTMYGLYESGDNAVSWANGKAVSGDSVLLMTLTEQTLSGGSSYVGVISSVDFSAENLLQSAVYGNTDAMMRLLSCVGKDLVPETLTIKPFASSTISIITTSQMLWWTVVLASTPAVLILVIAVVVLLKRRRA